MVKCLDLFGAALFLKLGHESCDIGISYIFVPCGLGLHCHTL